jgi:capsular exopolysaccharide synthesis family protein
MSVNAEHTSSPPRGPSWVDRYLPDQGGHAVPVQHDHVLDITMLRGMLWRQRYLLAGIVAIALALGLIWTLLQTPIYTARAMVRVDPGAGEIIEGQDLSPRVSANEIMRYLATLSAVVESRTMAYTVVDALSPALRERMVAPLADKPAATPAEKAARRELAVSVADGGITAEVPMDRRIIEITFAAEDPAVAAALANAYVEGIVTEDIRRNQRANSYAQGFLKDQIAETGLKLQDAELRANAFARASRIVSLGAPASDGAEGAASGAAQSISAANLVSINGVYAQARAKRIEAQQRWNAIASMPATQLPEVQQNGTVQGLQTERAKLSSQLSELLQRYGDDYPEVRETRARLDSTDRQIGQAAGSIKSALRGDYQIALRQEQGLLAELDKVSDQSLDEQDRRVQFSILEREASGLRSQLETLIQRYNQLNAAANVRTGEITKLDAATVPTSPSSPNLTRNLIVAFVLGTGLAIAVMVLREIVDDRLRSVEDVERKLGLPLLGVSPLIEGDGIDAENAELSEAYSSIRLTLDFALPRKDKTVLVVTSSRASEGKTTSAIIVAQKYAQIGRKVLLVDGDLRKPSVAAYFGKSRSPQGVVEVLNGECSLESALLDQPQDNLDVLPVGRIPNNPVDVLSSPLVDEFLKKQIERYSMIIFDAPPVIGLADTPLLTRLADGVIFIVEANRANFGQTKASLRRLRDAHAKIAGVILTKFHALDAGQSYDYSYSYYSYGGDRKD